MKETKSTIRMSAEMFLEILSKERISWTNDEIILILDANDYWDNRRAYTQKQKHAHVLRRLKMKTHNGRGHDLFISWPIPFQPTLYQLNAATYDRYCLGNDGGDDFVDDDEWPELVG